MRCKLRGQGVPPTRLLNSLADALQADTQQTSIAKLAKPNPQHPARGGVIADGFGASWTTAASDQRRFVALGRERAGVATLVEPADAGFIR
jgi:hypothetical protein